tara:strand:- start:103 stop:264 length:162 start_codon:yes stop_codon:yes gene_type:complete
VTLNGGCSGFDDKTVSITQTTPQQRQNGGMPPLTRHPHGLKPLVWVALIHRLA